MLMTTIKTIQCPNKNKDYSRILIFYATHTLRTTVLINSSWITAKLTSTRRTRWRKSYFEKRSYGENNTHSSHI
ncbi:hypothetical protein T03_10513 [Trichinella britovi]|uniref:Uncharacterized protein n=1 Tax=Trichinella britovi TaxID=45882 RepID=A0A0V1CNQ5_TRIBR|nr:hypothetical protein T03_10513 [Trichinella britovi]